MNNDGLRVESWEDLFSIVTRRGVIINLLVPFLLLAVGYLLRQAGALPDYPRLGDQTHRLVLYVLGAVALGELGVAYYLKKIMLRPSRFAELNQSFGEFAQRCGESMALVFAIGAAPAVYGLALYVLGGTLEQFLFFILISLLGYRLLRPGKEEVEKLWTDIGGSEFDDQQ